MLAQNKFVILGAAVAALAVLYLVKKKGAAGELGAAVGSAAVDAAGGVVAGASESIGDVFGIPRTNMTECEKAMAEGRTWDASFACPAGTFLKYAFGDTPDYGITPGSSGGGWED